MTNPVLRGVALVAGILLLIGARAAEAVPQAQVRVAVFDDPAYVDTTNPVPNAESDNVQASLAMLGAAVTTFTGVAEASWRAAAASADVILVPELEFPAGDLAAAMDENAEQALVDFVQSGGVLIVHGNSARGVGLINAVFNFASSHAAGGDSALNAGFSAGTRFAFGPPTLPMLSGTTTAGGMTGMYLTPAVTVAVGRIPVGAGKVIFLGWDWFNAAPLGTQDGGWNEVLRRAILEGRPPQRRVAVFADPAYTDTASPDPQAEARNVQASLVASDMLVTPITGIAFQSLGAPRRPTFDAVIVPELLLNLGTNIATDAALRVRDYVGTGGTLVVLGGLGANANPSAFLNRVFGFSTVPQNPGTTTSVQTNDVAGTLYGSWASVLQHFGANSGLGGLPPGSRSVYVSGSATTVALIPFGEGTIHFIGWNFLNAAPIGAQDGGWRGLLERAVRHSAPPRRVALFANDAFVDAIESPAQGAVSAEGVGLAASLVSRGHTVTRFTATDRTGWSRALANADVLAIPDLEIGALHTVLDAATHADVGRFVRNGGLLVLCANATGRAASLANAALGLSLSENVGGAASAITTQRFGTPFASGPANLPVLNATSLVAGPTLLPIYSAASGTTVGWVPAGAGHVLMLGWDFYDAAPAGGTQDGGWVDVLDLAVQAARPRTRHVAVFADDDYVHTVSPVPSPDAESVPAALELFDHRVSEISGTSAATFRAALAGVDTLLVPKQHVASLAPALSSEARAIVREFVAAGGELIAHADTAARTPELLNAIFGWSTAQQAASGSLLGGGLPGTRFGDGAGILAPIPNAGELVTASFPPGAQIAYADDSDNGAVIEIPYGRGRVIYLGWTYAGFPSLGALNLPWLDVLDRAVQETRIRTRRIAVYADSGYVDNQPGGEVNNSDRALEALGQARSYFFEVYDFEWSNALARTQALFLPELEVGDLSADIPPESRTPQLVRDFVADGGVLIAAQPESTFALDFLNRVFGFELTLQQITSSAPYARTAGAAGSVFATGPAELPNMNAVNGVGGLPAGALAVYANAEINAVVQIPYGAGHVVVLGWDFFGSRPFDANDIGQAAWREVLRRALELAPPDARHVALFDNPAFSGAAPDDPPRFLTATLLRQEHAVVPFSGTTLAAFRAALERADTLIVPDTDVPGGSLVNATDGPTEAEIRRFVRGGGALVTQEFGSASLSNALFGHLINEFSQTGVAPVPLTPEALGTRFSGGPSSVGEAGPGEFTGGWFELPVGARRIYFAGSFTRVLRLAEGDGTVVFLGYDYVNAAPLGTLDAGWLELLDRAVREGMGNDADGDGVRASDELCPLTADPLQPDTDADGVGNACDNCASIANPRVPPSGDVFLSANVWATLTGAQRDDDHDGYGNRCDAKFTPGALVGATDLVQFRASNGKARTLDVCGTTGTRPCAIFDLDEDGLLISATDLIVFRARNGKAPGPRCTTCPLPCETGASGTCEP